ncbi:MAG: DUF1330 domain-containing protein [Kiloniellaceae bacterium]
MSDNTNLEASLDRLIAWYGEGANGSAPTREQWSALLQRPQDRPITLINFFKMRSEAIYPTSDQQKTTSGEEAFARYAEVSVPTVEKVGGKFLLLAPFEFAFMGPTEDWDLVAIGSYPNVAALLALLEDADYRTAYPHRSAALARQKVIACAS